MTSPEKRKKKAGEESRLRNLKNVLVVGREKGRYEYEILGEVISNQQITVAIKDVGIRQGEDEEENETRLLVAQYMDYQNKDRGFKGYSLHCCVEAYKRIKATNLTKVKYLLPYAKTEIYRLLAYMLTIGLKLDNISEWLDDADVDLWRLDFTIKL